MNETLKVLKERRSIKKYKDILVSQELLKEILEAGTYAANGRGAQAGLIVATQNPILVKKLESLNARILENPDAKPEQVILKTKLVVRDSSVKRS